jgi:two-component system sensor histidine kinase UhpB
LPELDDAVTTCAYRIVQEALINALRHARASRIDVALDVEPNALVVRVADNGLGLPADWDQPGHYGVRGMRERAAALGGTFELDRGDEAGTRVLARLPLAALA